MRQQYENIMNTVITHIVRLYHIPNTSTIIKQLLVYLRTRYIAPVFYLNAHHARKEIKLIKTIQFHLKKHKYILRVKGRSGIFHLSNATDYERKPEAYRRKMTANIELHNDIFFMDVSEAITSFEYFSPGFVQERVPIVPLLFQIQLDELYRLVQSDFLQLKL